MERQLHSSLLILLVVCCISTAMGQTPGLIFKPADVTGSLVLDPNGDGYVSQQTDGIQIGFQTSDVTESEIKYLAVPVIALEPNADPGPGPDHLFNDIVDVHTDPNNAVFIALDSNNNLLIRFRLGSSSPNSKSYNFLIDIDGKFGFSGPNPDPNAKPGNPGFEIEVDLVTNFGIGLYDVDGTTKPSAKISPKSGALPYETHAQKSIALTAEHGDFDVFYDFYIPFSIIKTHFPSVNTSTPLRFLFATSMNVHPMIGNSAASDLGGIDDNKFAYNYDYMFDLLVGKLNPVSIDELSTGADLRQRTNCPSITTATQSTITGTYTPEINYSTGDPKGLTTEIEVFILNKTDTTSLGTTTADVTTGNWTLKDTDPTWVGITPAVDDTIIATALADNSANSDDIQYAKSYNNCDYELVSGGCAGKTNTAGVIISKISGGKGFTITHAFPTNTVITWYHADFTIADNVKVDDKKSTTLVIPNPVTTSSVGETVTFECKTGQCFDAGLYYFTFEEPGLCQSDYVPSCLYAESGSSTIPTITSSTITTSTTSISGTCGLSASADNVSTKVTLYADGEYLASTTIQDANTWTISGVDLTDKLCKTITVTSSDNNKCPSDGSNSVTVKRTGLAPTIKNETCFSIVPVTEISGFSTEEIGTTIKLYDTTSGRTEVGSTTVLAGGIWKISSLNLADGTTVVATASGACLDESPDSDPITISSASTNSAAITGSYSEGDLSVSGTGSNGDLITLYIDGYPVYKDIDETILASATVSGGNWTITDLHNKALYAAGTISVTVTSIGFMRRTRTRLHCSSMFRSLQIIRCSLLLLLNIREIIDRATITLTGSTSNIIYTPVLKSDGSAIGYSVLGIQWRYRSYNLSINQ